MNKARGDGDDAVRTVKALLMEHRTDKSTMWPISQLTNTNYKG